MSITNINVNLIELAKKYTNFGDFFDAVEKNPSINRTIFKAPELKKIYLKARNPNSPPPTPSPAYTIPSTGGRLRTRRHHKRRRTHRRRHHRKSYNHSILG
jgi:hypothetical protein